MVNTQLIDQSLFDYLLSVPFREKFERGINKSGLIGDRAATIGRCWDWIKGKHPRGYGAISLTKNGFHIHLKTHRVSWIIYKRTIPDGLCVCHLCDNPSCVNPDHLFIGDQADNMRDKRLKGRAAKADSHGNSKLNWDLVNRIRSEYWSKNLSQKELAFKFGINRSTLYDIVNRRSWVEPARG